MHTRTHTKTYILILTIKHHYDSISLSKPILCFKYIISLSKLGYEKLFYQKPYTLTVSILLWQEQLCSCPTPGFLHFSKGTSECTVLLTMDTDMIDQCQTCSFLDLHHIKEARVLNPRAICNKMKLIWTVWCCILLAGWVPIIIYTFTTFAFD